VGSLLSAVLLREPHLAPVTTPTERIAVERCSHCGITGPQLHPATRSPS
jgi:hypothetical protein